MRSTCRAAGTLCFDRFYTAHDYCGSCKAILEYSE